MTASPTSFSTGDTVGYTIAVANLGPTTATGVTVTVQLPSGMTFQSASGRCGSGQSFTCSLGNLGAGGTATIGVQTTASAPGDQTANASVSANEADPVGGNNSASVTVNGSSPSKQNPGVEGQVNGLVLVNGAPYVGGHIDFGATVDIKPGGGVNVVADVGTVFVFPPAGAEAQFVIVRGSGPALRATSSRAANIPIIEFRLTGGNFKQCKVKSLQTAPKPPIRRIWAKGKGHFRTKGRYSSATIRGTYWFTADTCDGTLTVVKKGIVDVFDLTKKKHVLVPAGKSYLAGPKPKKK